MQEVEKAKKELEEKKEAYKKLKRECQKQKKWIAEYQLLMRAGASGQHKVLLNISTVPSSDCSCSNPYALKLSSFISFVPFPYYITVMLVSLHCFHFLLFLYPSLILLLPLFLLSLPSLPLFFLPPCPLLPVAFVLSLSPFHSVPPTISLVTLPQVFFFISVLFLFLPFSFRLSP